MQSKEEQELVDAQIYEEMRLLKKQLKKLSKNQLVAVALDQMRRYMEQKQANEVLLERLESK